MSKNTNNPGTQKHIAQWYRELRLFLCKDKDFVLRMKRMAIIMHHISNYDHDHYHNLYLSLSQEPAKGFLRYFRI